MRIDGEWLSLIKFKDDIGIVSKNVEEVQMMISEVEEKVEKWDWK